MNKLFIIIIIIIIFIVIIITFLRCLSYRMLVGKCCWLPVVQLHLESRNCGMRFFYLKVYAKR